MHCLQDGEHTHTHTHTSLSGDHCFVFLHSRTTGQEVDDLAIATVTVSQSSLVLFILIIINNYNNTIYCTYKDLFSSELK